MDSVYVSLGVADYGLCGFARDLEVLPQAPLQDSQLRARNRRYPRLARNMLKGVFWNDGRHQNYYCILGSVAVQWHFFAAFSGEMAVGGE